MAVALTLLSFACPLPGSDSCLASEESGKRDADRKEDAKGTGSKGEGSGGGKEQDKEKPAEKTPEKPAEEARPVVDEAKVYFGKAHCCKAPAVVDADRLFRAIPEYRKILDDKLTDADPKYSVLLLKATRKFKTAVERAATEGSHDLVAAVGSVTWPNKTVPDITATVLLKLEEAERAAR